MCAQAPANVIPITLKAPYQRHMCMHSPNIHWVPGISSYQKHLSKCGELDDNMTEPHQCKYLHQDLILVKAARGLSFPIRAMI